MLNEVWGVLFFVFVFFCSFSDILFYICILSHCCLCVQHNGKWVLFSHSRESFRQLLSLLFAQEFSRYIYEPLSTNKCRTVHLNQTSFVPPLPPTGLIFTFLCWMLSVLVNPPSWLLQHRIFGGIIGVMVPLLEKNWLVEACYCGRSMFPDQDVFAFILLNH